MRGNIRKRGPNSWALKFDIGRQDGKRVTRYATVRGSYRDAQRALTRLIGEADKGLLAEPTQQRVGEYLLSYLDSVTNVSPKTLERYRELAAQQVIPHLGEIKLQGLRPEHIEKWHASLLSAGLAPLTIRHAHSVLKLVLGRAVENGTLSRNIAALRRPPVAEETEVEVLAPGEITAVLEALRGHTLFPIASLALATGMRRGELLSLEWSDIDLERAVLRVERSLEETRAGLRVKPPKSKRGRRNISLPAESVSMLREHRNQQRELRLLA
jgi:integrase